MSDDIWADVVPCPVHPLGVEQPRGALDPDDPNFCQTCVNEQQAREVALDGVQDDIAKRGDGLRRQGVGIDPQIINMVRLDCLIEGIFWGRSRMLFEGEVGRRLLAMVKEAQAQASRSALLGQDKRLHVVRNGVKGK